MSIAIGCGGMHTVGRMHAVRAPPATKGHLFIDRHIGIILEDQESAFRHFSLQGIDHLLRRRRGGDLFQIQATDFRPERIEGGQLGPILTDRGHTIGIGIGNFGHKSRSNHRRRRRGGRTRRESHGTVALRLTVNRVRCARGRQGGKEQGGCFRRRDMEQSFQLHRVGLNSK